MTEIWTDRPISNSCGHDTGGGLCVMNSGSDDHTTVSRIHVLSRVVSRLNSEFCIPLFWVFDSGLNNKSANCGNKTNKQNRNVSVFLFGVVK